MSENQVSDIRRIVKSKGIDESILTIDNGSDVAILSIDGWDEKLTIIGNDISWRVGLASNRTNFKANEELYEEVNRWAELLSLFMTGEGKSLKSSINKGEEAGDYMPIIEDTFFYKHPHGVIIRDEFLPNVSSTQSEFSLGITLDDLDYKTHDIFAELKSKKTKATKGYISTGSKVKAQFFIDVVYMKSAYDDINNIIHSLPPFNRNQNLKEFDILLVCRSYNEIYSQIEISNFDLDGHSITDSDKAILVYNNPFTFLNIEIDRLTKISILNEDVFPTIGVTELAAEITELLKNIDNNERGRMIGIFGQWGRGKTFLWKQIDKQLEASKGKNPFITLEFHAWKYQDTPAVWAYLYENIAQKYFGKGIQRFIRYINVSFKKYNIKRIPGWILFVMMILTGVFFIYRLYRIPEYGKLFFSTGVIATIVTIFSFVKKNKNNALSFITKYGAKSSFKGILGTQAEVEKELKALLSTWIPIKYDAKGEAPDEYKNHKRILLFVDDIDRCSEDKIIQIIDALKVMLEDPDISRRVLVLTAIDERVLQRAINVKYKDMVDKDLSLSEAGDKANTLMQLVREYMDKLFIAGIKLGPLTANQRKAIFDVFAVNREEEEVKGVSSTGGSTEDKPETSKDDKALTNKTSDLGTKSQKTAKEDDNREQPVPDTKQEEKYTLSHSEYEAMTSYLEYYHNGTPRSIRIFYFRYLLARNLLHEELKLDTEINRGARNSIEELSDAHHILAAMLVHYGQFGPEDFAGRRRTLTTDENISELQYCNEAFSPSWQLYYVLLKVVEMTVAY